MDVFEFTAEMLYISDQEKVEILKMEMYQYKITILDVEIKFSQKECKSNILLKSI